MDRTWDKFQADLKKWPATLKTAGLVPGEALKKQMLNDLQSAWDKEDVLRAAIKKAKESGIDGDKPRDFDGDKGYAACLSTWKKAVATYRGQIKTIESFGNAARKLHTPWAKRHKTIEKDLKKAKLPKDEQKKADKVMQTSAAVLADLDGAARLFNSLKAHELYYAMKLAQTMDAIVAETLKKSGGGAANVKLLEEATRRKNVKTAEKMYESIIRLVDDAVDQAGHSPRKATKSIKMAKATTKKLEDLNSSYQTLKKKEAKTIAAAKDKKYMLDAIEHIADLHESAQSAIDEGEKEAKKAKA